MQIRGCSYYKVQAYRKEQEIAKAAADLAYEIEANKVKKQVTETEMQVEITRKQMEIEVAAQEASRTERELEATVVKMADADKYKMEVGADADKYKVEKNADADKYKVERGADAVKYREIQDAQARSEAIRLEGTARAEAKRLEGMAEVDIIREKGKAEAEAMLKKAEAYKQYNDAAVTQMIIERLPEMARAVAEPLSKTDKIVIVDQGNTGENGTRGAAKVTNYITDIITSLPQTVEALTGIDVWGLIKNANKDNSADGNIVSEE